MSDPLFLDHFRRQLRSHEAPVSLTPVSMKAPTYRDIFKQSLTYSIVAHAGIVLLSLAIPFVLNSLMGRVSYEDRFQNKEFRNAIRVDMVGLPALTLQELQKIDPTEEVGLAPKKAEVAPQVSDTAMKLNEAKEDQKKKAEEQRQAQTREKAKAEAAAKERKRLDDIRASLRVEEQRQRLASNLQEQVGSAEGRMPLAGNIISEGYSVTGDVASDMDVYQGHLKAHLRKTWNLPGWMQASSLSARVLVKLSSDGRILKQEFLRTSGNSDFDRYVVEALKNAEPFPGAPPSLQRKVMEEGVEWGFPQ